MRRATLAPLCLVVIGCCMLGCGGKEAGKPARVTAREPTLAPDGSATVSVRSVGDEEYVVRDGEKVAGPFDRVTRLLVSPGGRSGVVARQGDRWTVSVGGKTVGSEFESADDLVFSADGSSFVFRAVVDGEPTVIKDGTPVDKGYDEVSSLSLSPDGDSLAYVGWKGGEVFVVVDGKPASERYSRGDMARIGTPSLGPAPGGGPRPLAFTVRLQTDSFVVKNGNRIGPTYRRAGDPIWSPDGRSVVFPARLAGKWYVIEDETKVAGPFDQIAHLGFETGTGKLVVAARVEDKWRILRGGETVVSDFEATEVRDPIFGPGGAGALKARFGETWSVVKGGERLAGSYEEVSRLAPMAGGGAFAFAARMGKNVERKVVDW